MIEALLFLILGSSPSIGAQDPPVAGGTLQETECLRKDEENEETIYGYDALGRPNLVSYPDGTSEELRYQDATGLVLARRDRANRWTSSVHDGAGRVTEIHEGETPSEAATLLVRYDYDVTGRLLAEKNRDAAVFFEDHDFDGRPRITRTVRYADHSGLNASPQPVDQYSQRHVWNVFGERESWTMPVARITPLDASDNIGGNLVRRLVEERDGAGNLVAVRDGAGEILYTAEPRSVGRLDQRSFAVAGSSNPLTMSYRWWDGSESPHDSGAQKLAGMRRSAVTTHQGVILGGSTNRWNVQKKIERLIDPGSDRGSRFDYDGRARLRQATIDRPLSELDSVTPTETDYLTPADFRFEREAALSISAVHVNQLGDTAYQVERPSWNAVPAVAHQIDGQTYALADLPERAYGFTWDGGRRTSDGRWTSEYDIFGRLVALTSADDSRRIEYDYDPRDRMVGRRSLVAAGGSWTLEDSAASMGRDGLPSHASFVWDPLTDHLVSIYHASSAGTAEEPLAGLVMQVLHGDQDYDDPVLLTRRSLATPEPGEGGPLATRHFVVRDEAGTGSVDAIVNGDGTLAERTLYGDAYGDAPRYLHGPLTDRVEVTLTKDDTGEITSARIRLHVTDPIDEATLSSGVSLRAVAQNGAVTGVSLVEPVFDGDRMTVLWELDADAWQALTGAEGTHAIEVSVTDILRTEVWGDLEIMSPPDWAQQLYGVRSIRAPPDDDITPDRPFVITSSVAYLESLAQPETSSAWATLFAIPDLYLAASRESRTKLLTGFKAAPFVEPATGLVYLRARWYDPGTGTFLTPDPSGYQDSSNLYAGFAGDPANLSDPTGEAVNLVAGAASVGVGFIATCIFDECSNYTLADAGVDFGLGVATFGLGNIAKLRHLSRAGRWGVRVGAEAGLDVGAEALRHTAHGRTFGEDYGFGDLALGAAMNLGIGEGGAFLSTVGKRFHTAPQPRTRINLLTGRSIQSAPEGIRFGPVSGGGKEKARLYAYWATEGAEKSIYLRVPGLGARGEVELDALIDRVLIEAKAAGEIRPRSIYDVSAQDPWLRGVARKRIMQQADRHLAVAARYGFEVEWRLADERMADAIAEFFAEQLVPIRVRHLPLPDGLR